MISLILAQVQNTGAISKLRESIVEVLLASIKIHDSPAPPSEDPRRAYLYELLSCTLPATKKGHIRRACLMKDLTGDVLSDEIDVHTPGGLDEMEVQMWASSVAKALYPCATKMFPRGRWINSLEQ